MAQIEARIGQIRDRSRGYPEISYTVGNKSKTFLKECLRAHEAIIEVMPPAARANLTNSAMRATTLAYVALDGPGRKELLQRMIFANFAAQAKSGSSLREMTDAWYTTKSAQAATATMLASMMRYKTSITDFFEASGLKTTADLSPQTAADFLAWRSQHHYGANKAEGSTTSASVLRHELQALKQMAHVAKKNGWIDDSRIWDDVQVRSIVGQNTKEVMPLSISDQKAVLAAMLSPKREKMHDATLLLLITGMRVGELDTLEPSSIVAETLQLHGQSIGSLKPSTGKTASAVRVLPVCQTIKAIFERGHIFGYKADRLKTTMGRGWFADKFPHVHAHALRHTFAVNKLLSGTADMQMVKYQLGHSDITTTLNLYGKFSPEHFKAGFEHIKAERAELLTWLEQDYFGTAWK